MLKKFPENEIDLNVTDQRRSYRPVVVCAQCRNYITDTSAKRSVEGEHFHTCINPAGITYTVGCYHYAPGCVSVGVPTAEHSWFSGFRWRIALCGSCGNHLGWHFTGESTEFYGLILKQIAEQSIE